MIIYQTYTVNEDGVFCDGKKVAESLDEFSGNIEYPTANHIVVDLEKEDIPKIKLK